MAYTHCTNLRYSPDGTKLAYLAEANGKFFVVTNGEESDGYADAREAYLHLPFTPRSE